MSAEPSKRHQWQWENATAGAAAGFATVAVMHPLDVVRTRFQVNDGRVSHLPSYKNTAHAVFTIARSELMAFASISWFVKYATCYDFRMSLFLKKEKYPDRMIAEPSRYRVAEPSFLLPTFGPTGKGGCGGGGIISQCFWLMDVKTNSKAQCSSIHILFIGLGLRGLYAGFLPGVLGSTISYDKAKQRYARNREGKLSPGLHLASAAEAGGLVSLCTNPVWLVKTRLQLQTPLHQTRPYSGIYDAFKTILREEGFSAFYKGIVPSLFLVSHGAIQFTAYEELRKVIVDFKSKRSTVHNQNPDKLLNSVDYAVLGATSKLAAILLTYPFQVQLCVPSFKVMRARLQVLHCPFRDTLRVSILLTQRPSGDGVPRYIDTWHVVKETARFEGIRGYYRGITANLLKNAPASSITFIVYENVLKLLKPTIRND
ncbi:hypothetical protein V8G54_004658 [Vigna mungo]|uniref:Uncharacterized protein n=1 Tax=Vigna mungo TaxID=3915 RepID=A0AAQ3PG95_VIGMU